MLTALSGVNGEGVKRKGRPTVNLLDRTFGRLTVIGPAEPKVLPNGARQAQWMCECVCKTVLPVRANHLLTSNSESCGCLHKERAGAHNKTHGMSGYIGKKAEPEYRVWHQMRQRCENPSNRHYADYGGRGIAVCDRWSKGEGDKGPFECFIEDMRRRPSPKLTLEREDNNGGYSKQNCSWSTRKAQLRNTRRTVFVTYQGRRMPLSAAVELSPVSYEAVQARRKSRWPEVLLFVPLGSIPQGPGGLAHAIAMAGDAAALAAQIAATETGAPPSPADKEAA